jgi:hypothetical protein
MSMPPKLISKSCYLAGLQCPKRLWLELYRYDLKDEVDPATQAVFDQGQEVGELARLLYPDGLLIKEDHLHIPQAIQKEVTVGFWIPIYLFTLFPTHKAESVSNRIKQ